MGQEAKKFVTALYGRTSKDDPRRVTIEIQQHALRTWSVMDPLVGKVFDEYWDDGVTGKLPLFERPEGKRLLEDVHTGKIESVAVAYADRFGRTLLDGLQTVKALENYGVKLVAINDGWDARRNDSPLYFQFRMMMAEEEHRRISQRMRDGKLRAMDRDQAPPGGPLVFGYRMDSQGRYVPDPVEAPIVVRIFEMYLAGHSQAEILVWLRTTGARPGRKFQKRVAGSEPAVTSNHEAAGWHQTKVSKILRCRVYLGERKWKERTFPCLPLITQEMFDKAQALLASRDNGSGVGKRWQPSHGLLTGILTCGTCGSKFYHKTNVIHRVSGKVDRYSVYWCERARRKWADSCKAKMVPVAVVDKVAWGYVEAYLRDPERIREDVMAVVEKIQGEVSELESEEADLSARLQSLDAEAESVWKEQEANDWPMSWVSKRLNELMDLRKEVLAKLTDLNKGRGNLALSRERVDAFEAAVEQYRARLDSLTPADKRVLVRLGVWEGVVHTEGSGNHKTATIRFQFARRKELTTVYPNLPKQWCNGNEGYATLRVALHVGR